MYVQYIYTSTAIVPSCIVVYMHIHLQVFQVLRCKEEKKEQSMGSFRSRSFCEEEVVEEEDAEEEKTGGEGGEGV